MLPMVKALVSVMVIFVPQAVTVPKSFVVLPSVILPAVPVPVFVTSVVPVTVAVPAWVMAPPVVTVRFVAVIVPRTTASVSLIVTFVPLAVTVPKLFVELLRVTLPTVPAPDETKFAVPLIARLPAPVCVIELPEISVRLLRLITSVFTIAPVVLLPIVSMLAVMLPISVDVRPKLPLDFVPRSTTVPEVGISSTEPEDVALTVLVMVTFWAVI